MATWSATLVAALTFVQKQMVSRETGTSIHPWLTLPTDPSFPSPSTTLSPFPSLSSHISAYHRLLETSHATQCCPCTCVDGPLHICGSYGYNCVDPTCFDSAVVATFPNCTGDWSTIGDGICTMENNNPDCGYDGGDVSWSVVTAAGSQHGCTSK